MPAKFSEAFYQKFGHTETGELMDWLNEFDAAYRASFERLADLTGSRVDTVITQAEARADLRYARLAARIDLLETRIEHRLGQLDSKFDNRYIPLEGRLNVRLAQLNADLTAWILLVWFGLAGLVVLLMALA